MSTRVSWVQVLNEARAIVESYDTLVTLRQLYYRLVAKQIIPNLPSYYRRLSSRTAEARRDGTFPDLIDNTRWIHEPISFDSPNEGIGYLKRLYRRDRTEGQPVSLYLGAEKDGIVAQLSSWFGNLGVPIIAVGGYASQSYCDEVAAHVGEPELRDRPAVLLYAGDHDASGQHIGLDFVARTGCWDKVHRIALSPEQAEQYGCPPGEGKDDDPRREWFEENFGAENARRFGIRNVQIEMDAIEPVELRRLYQAAIDQYWDADAYRAALAREEADRAELDQRWS